MVRKDGTFHGIKVNMEWHRLCGLIILAENDMLSAEEADELNKLHGA